MMKHFARKTTAHFVDNDENCKKYIKKHLENEIKCPKGDCNLPNCGVLYTQ